MRIASSLAVLAIGGLGVTVGWLALDGGWQTAYAEESAAAAENPKTAAAPAPDSVRYFETHVAPLLVQHCVQCHGSTSQKGGLDLSRKKGAFAGGNSGDTIVAGKAEESLLWHFVASDEMPLDQPPLSPEEKVILVRWIDAGALWSDQAMRAHSQNRGGASQWLRRLTVPEYIATVRSAVGVDIQQDARRMLPPDLRADGFNNTAYNLNVDLGHVEAYARLAALIVQQMDVRAFAAEFSQCQELNDACMRELITGMGKWLLRGPLEQHEIDAFLNVSRAVANEDGDFVEAASYVIEAMLQSPRFIYLMERQRGDDAIYKPSDYELASRMSYILWGAPPDRQLFRAADAGQLSHRTAVAAQVQRMLHDPRAIERSSQFLYQWLDLDRLDHLRPSPDRFPEWDPRIAGDMREETLAFFKAIAWDQQRPLSDLMNAQFTYATPPLAAHYGLQPQAGRAVGNGQGPSGGPAGGRRDLQALYTFSDATGETIRDVSDAGQPLNLTIDDLSAVQRVEDGLRVKGPVRIATQEAPQRLVQAVKKSGAFSLDAWITPADTDQDGPARILTLSRGTGQRNFTLGQDGDKYDVRFRATKTSANGLPSLSSPDGSAQRRLTHVVYTRSLPGRAHLYVDGQQVASGNVDGALSNWDDGFQLTLANESTGDRPWRGTLHMVALYSRALAAEEVRDASTALARYDLTRVPARGGLLTQGSVLTIGGDEASMVTRGLFVLNQLLFSEVGDPPPGLDTTPVPPEPGLPQREIALERVHSVSCGGCHSRIEPLAFGLEKFDGLGAYREVDQHGNRLRDDGEILFPGQQKPVAYQSAAELMDLLAASERVRQCLTRKVTQFALGRPLVEADAASLEQIHSAAQQAGGTYASLITAIVMSDLVQTLPTETER